MKNLLTPIDFSSQSIEVLKDAVHLAHRFGARLHVVHAYFSHIRADTIMDVNQRIKEDTEAQLADLIAELELPDGLEVEARSLRGDPVDAIRNYCAKWEIDLIVMATQGESNDPGVFLGPVSGGLIKATDIPVLVVPGQGSLGDIRHILFVMKSLVIDNEQQLVPLQKVKAVFGASLSILQIRTPEATPEDLIPDNRIIDLDAPIAVTEAENVYKGLSAYLQQSDVPYGLVCVMRRRRNFLELLLTRSLTRKEKFDSAIPMLVLRGTK